VQIGFPLGLVASYGVFALTTSLIPDAQFRTWGWRIPFLLSILLLVVGWYVRARVPETPLFQDLRSRGDVLKNPFFEAVLRNPRVFLIAVGLKLSEVSWVYILTVFVVVYGTKTLGLSRQLLLNAVFVAALVELFTIPLFGWLSDVWGRRHLYFVGTLFTIGFAFPLFWLLETRNPAIIVPTVIIALSFGHGTMFGLQSTFFPELFATRVRYTGASFGFQTSAAIGGGLAPILATVLADRMGGTAGVSILLILLALITLVATLCARETRHDSLERQ
jgi:MHS family shikimate/dehydroshikimate transporter-like MFS transporter